MITTGLHTCVALIEHQHRDTFVSTRTNTHKPTIEHTHMSWPNSEVRASRAAAMRNGAHSHVRRMLSSFHDIFGHWYISFSLSLMSNIGEWWSCTHEFIHLTMMASSTHASTHTHVILLSWSQIIRILHDMCCEILWMWRHILDWMYIMCPIDRLDICLAEIDTWNAYIHSLRQVVWLIAASPLLADRNIFVCTDHLPTLRNIHDYIYFVVLLQLASDHYYVSTLWVCGGDSPVPNIHVTGLRCINDVLLI